MINILHFIAQIKLIMNLICFFFLDRKCTKGVKKYNKVIAKSRVAFRFKSDLDVLDDGFKWRKYGKKMVKNRPNPR